MQSNTAHSSPTIEAYAELQTAFDHYNRELFGGKVPRCLITMQREKRTFGYFSSKRFVHRLDKETTDEIAINPSYFGVLPLLEILQTLVHEMTHAWQFHFGKPGRRGYHNQQWADKMESLGLMPSSTGKPGGAKTGEKIADYAIEDGPFLQATKILLESGFLITWLDRYPPSMPDSHMPEAASLPTAATQSPFDLQQPTSSVSENQAGSDELLVRPPAKVDRSNRVKYRCPSCNAQVWGKPGLKLICGEVKCGNNAFEPIA